MSKADNLTEFLTGVADKLRALLGETARMNPQSFEEKIQEVYDRGFASGGPDTASITATAEQVVSGKTFGAGGQEVRTGTMPLRVTGQAANSCVLRDETLYYRLPHGCWPNTYSNTECEAGMGQAAVAEAIGLTAEKLMEGNTVLGVSGKAVPMVMASFEINYAGGSQNPAATGCAAYGATKSGTGYVTLPAGTYRVVGHAGYDTTAGIGLWVAKQGALGTALKSGTKLNYVQECIIDDTLTLSAAATVTVVAHSDTAGHGRRGAVTITKTA